MEFIHISDIHYGMKPKFGDLAEIKEALLDIVQVCNERGSELLLISGDLFHSIPDREQLREVDYILGKLLYTKTFVIAGNHDYMVKGGMYAGYRFESNTHVFLPGMEYCNGDDLGINADIYGISYDSMYMADEKNASYFADKYQLNEDKVNILLLHGGTKGQMDIKFEEFADSGFDYVALGHIHKKETLGANVAYAGSLVPLDHTETGEHGYIVGNIDEMSAYPGKRTRINFVPLEGKRFENVTIELNQYMTPLGIKERIISKMCAENTYYTLIFKGVCTQGSVVFDGKAGENALNVRELLGDESLVDRIVEVKDYCRPYEELDKLYLDNADNIIGRFIEKTKSLGEEEDVKDMILNYGLDALSEGRWGSYDY